jgi:DNA polymerase phi
LIDSHRIWAIDQMLILLRNKRILKSDAWMTKVIQFLCVHSLFAVEQNASISNFDIVKPSPDLSENVREQCKVRFYSALADLNNTILPSQSDSNKKLLPGQLSSSESWAYYIATLIANVENIGPNIRLYYELVDEAKMLIEKSHKMIGQFREKAKVKSDSDETLKLKYKALEHLFLNVLLCLYTEQEEYINILEVCKLLFFFIYFCLILYII